MSIHGCSSSLYRSFLFIQCSFLWLQKTSRECGYHWTRWPWENYINRCNHKGWVTDNIWALQCIWFPFIFLFKLWEISMKSSLNLDYKAQHSDSLILGSLTFLVFMFANKYFEEHSFILYHRCLLKKAKPRLLLLMRLTRLLKRRREESL